MLLNLMYHQIVTPEKPEMLDKFEQHLKYLKSNYHITTPTLLRKNQINVSLVFDDAYFDFYHYVFPLLKKYQIKAILGVPTGLLADNNTLKLGLVYPTPKH